MTGLPKSVSGTPLRFPFSLAAADTFFGIFGYRRVQQAPTVCAWCLKGADADHTACRRMAGGGA